MTERRPEPGSPWARHCPEAFPREWVTDGKLPTGFKRPASAHEADRITGRASEAEFLRRTGKTGTPSASSGQSRRKGKPSPVVRKVFGWNRFLDGLANLESGLHPLAVAIWCWLWRCEKHGGARASERKLAMRFRVGRGSIRARVRELTEGGFRNTISIVFLKLTRRPGAGSTLPLRADLATELRQWIGERRLLPAALLFSVPARLVRILARDLRDARIPKKDDRGRVLDVHALRVSFATHLGTTGTAPRTAQAAMRHSDIKLMMGVYTDPRFLEVRNALERLPAFTPAGEVSGNSTTKTVTKKVTNLVTQRGNSWLLLARWAVCSVRGRRVAYRSKTLKMATKKARGQLSSSPGRVL